MRGCSGDPAAEAVGDDPAHAGAVDAEVLVRVAVAGTDDRRVLHLYGDPRSVRVAGFRVEPVELLSYPLNRPLADPPPPTIDVTVTAAP